MLSGTGDNGGKKGRKNARPGGGTPEANRAVRKRREALRSKKAYDVNNMSVGDYLRELRSQSGLSLRQVVMMSDEMLDKTTVSRVEKNSRTPSLRAAYAFSQIYRVKMENIAEMALDKKLMPGPAPFAVSDNERELLEKLRSLPRTRRNLIFDVVGCITQHCESDENGK